MRDSGPIRSLQALLLVGGAVGSREIAKDVARAQRDQAALVAQLEEQTARSLGGPRKPKVAVDRLFADRLARILRMCAINHYLIMIFEVSAKLSGILEFWKTRSTSQVAFRL